MSRACELCGKHSAAVNNVARRGGANYVLARTKRTQRPNLQTATLLVNGRLRRMKVCAQCIKNQRG